MASPTNYLSPTNVTVGNVSTTWTTNHNTIDQQIADQLLEIDGDGNVIGGILEGFKDFLAKNSVDNVILALVGESFTGLKTLAEEGYNGSYISEPMARQVEALLNSLAAVGVTIPDEGDPFPILDEDLKEWLSIATFNSDIRGAVESLVNSVRIERYTFGDVNNPTIGYRVVPSAGYVGPIEGDPLNRMSGSLQAMIELIYIKGANEFLSNNMESLEEALETTKSSIDVLADLQNLHNQLKVPTQGASGLDLLRRTGTTSDADLRAEYDAISRSFFETSPVPELGAQLIRPEDAIENAYDFINDTLISGNPTDAFWGGDAMWQDFSKIRSVAADIVGAGSLAVLQTKLPVPADYESIAVIPDDSINVIKYWIRGATGLNKYIDRVNDALDVINDVLTSAGITSLPAPYNTYTLPLKMEKVPEPPVSLLDLANIENNPAIETPLKQWAQKVLDYTTTTGNLLSNSFWNGKAPLSFAADMDSLIFGAGLPDVTTPNGTIISYSNLFAVGVPDEGIQPIGSAGFYKTITQAHETITNIINNLQANPDPNNASLLQRLIQVLNDINNSGFLTMKNTIGASFNPASTSHYTALQAFAQNWLIDKNDQIATTDVASIGRIQNNLGYAIGAGQALNDTQKEETRRFLFIFEEFYKSAATILNKITQIIEKIAQGINR